MKLKDLNPEQKQAVTHGDGPLLIIAGAGTGKTTVITQRVAWLVEQNKAKTDEILALTFTDKAAGEMEERVDKLLPYGYVDLWIMTFHAFCERILKQHGLDIGIPNDFKLLNQTEQWLLVRQNLNKFNLDYYRPLGNPTKFIHALIKHFSRCKDEEIWPEDYLEYAEKLKINQDNMESTKGQVKKIQNSNDQKKQDNNEATEQLDSEISGVDSLEIERLEEIANAYHTYQQLLLDNNSLDFGDLINYTLKLFKKRPLILNKYRKQFKYILVDEFQDTNWAQYELVKLLAAPDNNITAVSDDDQAIYRWRGASYNNAIQFKKDFPNAKQISLIENYRSSQNILDLAYNFIQLNNPERLEAQFGGGKLSKKLKSNTQEEGIIEHLHARDETEEVRMVVKKIIELKNKDEEKHGNAPESTSSWNDFAILVRANIQANAFVNVLSSSQIPYQYLASRGLYSKPIILDILAYLKLLDNYHESAALWRILNLPFLNFNHQDLMNLNYLANRKSWSLYEALTQTQVQKNFSQDFIARAKQLIAWINKHTALAQEKGAKEVVLAFLEDLGYLKFLTQKDNLQNRNSLNWLNQFYRKINEFEKSFDDKSVKNFIDLINLELESGDEGTLENSIEEGPEAVKIMTIHSAKGLEFKYVFIVNMVDKRFPTVERKEPIELPDELIKEIIPSGDIHLQEERRLFYVAMTRAKRGLFFTSAEDYGGQRKKKLSRFLYEIGMGETTEGEAEKNKKKYSEIEGKDKAQKPLSTSPAPYIPHAPFRFSYTQLKAFETCPYQYRFAHILHVPTRGKATFSFGKTMHTTLQRFFSLIKEQQMLKQSDLFGTTHGSTQVKTQINADKLPSLEELLNIYQQSWIDDWYESKQQKEEYRKKGEKILREFFKQLEGNIPKVFALEQNFNFRISNYIIKGVIDRIDILSTNKNNPQVGGENQSRPSPAKVEIIDYKTGNPPKSEKYLEKDQLLIYQIAARESLGLEPAKLTFYYLDNNQPMSFLGQEKDLEKIKTKILETIEQIKKSDFAPTPSPFKCKYCDFKDICEFRQL